MLFMGRVTAVILLIKYKSIKTPYVAQANQNELMQVSGTEQIYSTLYSSGNQLSEYDTVQSTVLGDGRWYLAVVRRLNAVPVVDIRDW